MALAIELAAARHPSLGLDGLITALDQRLRFLTTGSRVADRHRSLRDAIAWSNDLLAADDRTLLRGVSVFASWFDVQAATAVAGQALQQTAVSDGLARLADHNLLVVTPGEPTRYRALETIRQYAAEQLAEFGESQTRHDRHRRWCLQQLAALATDARDDAWRERVDRMAADARAAITLAVEQEDDAAAAELAEQLAAVLFLRSRPAEAQRRYEQAARHAAPGAERARLLRMAAGAAAARLVGNDTLRLLDAAAGEAVAHGDRAAAALDRAWMVIYLRLTPGIIADLPNDRQRDSWFDEARVHASGSPAAEAALATAIVAGLPDSRLVVALATEAAASAGAAGAPLVQSAALDRLCANRMVNADLTSALDVTRQRGDVLAGVPLDASSAFQFNDYLLMASELNLAAGNLALAGQFADTLAALACYREQGYPAIARRIKVDALAGDLEAAAAGGERFLVAWQQAGRPLASTLATTAYAIVMVQDLLGDERRRLYWLEISTALTKDPGRLATCSTGYAPTFDAIVALDRGDPEAALARLTADLDDPDVWLNWNASLWRPWYAALWAESAVLAGHPEAQTRLRRSIDATRENPIATAMVQRAADLDRGDGEAVRRHAHTFAELGCRYQQRRTQALLERRQEP
jgi:hypothetical protein